MRIPLIKIKSYDNDGKEHIVGTSFHDTLFLDEETGGIHYQSLQSCETTRKVIEGHKIDPAYAFACEEPDPNDDLTSSPQVEFVSLEELFEIVMKELELSAKEKIQLNKMTAKYAKEKEKQQRKLKRSQKKTGVRFLFH